ncbi:hypothetical protein D5018_04580 [Parashewanella curva]|uniref:Tetratricopeptide repeat protein n=1 Tax=Parashewanella curva TaxID=2338552 RepID=A0A3L8Q2Z6_9GAMM|nr:multiheme c-type cytochrome [Parashewanella curva]RLV60922.1 hypothetical protein D5018_04580 [Parashewanella curva]
MTWKLKIILSSFLFLMSLFIGIANASPTHSVNCTSCHKTEHKDWLKSDHAKAMMLPNDQSVLGNFNNVTVKHHTQKARFFKKGKTFWVELIEGGKTQRYQIAYTFGHYPLQQYLIKTNNGRYQTFSFSWDSRTKSEGGQRWYPNYADEDVKPNDRFHWQQPLQNWNGMCADCHSQGLTRNYDKTSNTFNTTFEGINVNCKSCHTVKDDHFKAPKPKVGSQLDWMFKPGENIASRTDSHRDNRFMDTCFACHALRTPLTDGIDPAKPFLDQFTPDLLAAPLYHADGQIKEEVYVYGSFLQSKMYKAGVNCLDCHDKHTMKVKAQNNGLCLQCHKADAYQTQAHLNHPFDSEGAQCVSCHMPETRYMGVDDRRDHSFSIPRPSLTEEFGIPNACSTCHKDKPVSWSTAKVASWYGKSNTLTQVELDYILLQKQGGLPLSQHLAVINDHRLAVIKRASAIALLPNSTRQIDNATVEPWINSKEPLIRLAVAKIGQLLPEGQRQLSLPKLLKDQYRAIRVTTATALLDSHLTDMNALKAAYDELVSSHDTNAWRGEGSLNASQELVRMRNYDAAIVALNHSIKVDPYFAESYINLTDIYRNLRQANKERKVYSEALQNVPNSAVVSYSYGLFLIRQKQHQQALTYFKRAVNQASDNAQYAYVYYIALDSLGRTQQAISELKEAIAHYQHNSNLLNLGRQLSQKLQDVESYEFFSTQGSW